MAIRNDLRDTERLATDPVAIALRALAWTLADQDRSDRLLAITGLHPAELRARAAEPGLLAATLEHLEAHEPDLLACADALGLPPAALVAARAALAA